MKVKLVDPFSATDPAPKALLIVGGAITLRLAVAVFPVPAVEVTWTLLFNTPAVVPVTLTDTAHEALEARVPADKLTDDNPAAAVAVPPQVLLRLGVAATTRPDGRLSVNATPVSDASVLGFVMVSVREVVPLSGIEAAPKALEMVGLLGMTWTLTLLRATR